MYWKMRVIAKVIVVFASIFPLIYCQWQWSLMPKEVNYIFKWTDCKHFNTKFIYKVACPYTFVRRSIKETKLEVYINPGLAVDKIFVEASTLKKFGTVWRPTLVKIKDNLCDAYGNKSHTPMAQAMRSILRNTNTNLLKPCPFTGLKYRYGRIDTTAPFPPLVPIGEWKLILNLTTTMNGMEEFLVEFIDRYEVTQKTATQF